MEGNIIVTVIGKDHPGIVATVSTKLTELNINIVDITQTIFDNEIFAMIMLVNADNSLKEFDEVQKEVSSIETNSGTKIYVQHEDIFKVMHRI